MARIRSIKPDFFMNEEVATLSFPARLLFIGLWTLADREGRLEDRPKRIKASVFPYDDVAVEPLLAELAGLGFIRRYEVTGTACVEIRGFIKHQRPHPKEGSYGLPAPLPLPSTESREGSRQGADASRRVLLVVGSGSGSRNGSGNGSGSMASPAGEVEQVALLPTYTQVRRRAEDLQALWNELAEEHGLGRWQGMSEARKRAAEAALEACPDLERWRAFLAEMLAQPFFRGENDRGWRADVNWLLRSNRRDQVADFEPGRAPAAVNAAGEPEDGIPF